MNFKLTIYPCLEVSREWYTIFEFETAEQMVVASQTAANLLNFLQVNAQLMPDYSNIFLMQELVSGEWEEYEEF